MNTCRDAVCSTDKFILNTFSLYYQNVGGLRTKIEDFYVKSSALDFDIIVFCETWLNENHNTTELVNCKLYNVFRKDRCALKTGLNRGGGVLIAVKNCFSVKSLPLKYLLSASDTDQLIILITFSNKFEVFLAVSYIPPNSTLESYETHFKNCSYYFDNLKSHQHIIYVGDFNLGNILWNPDVGTIPFISNSHYESLLLDFLSIYNLKQINNMCNDNSRLLDLVFVDKDIISEAFTPIMPIFEKSFHHSPLIIELSSQFYQPFHPINNEYYNFKKADFVALNSFLRTFDWVLEFQDKNLQNMYVSFLKIIKEGLNNFVPKKYITCNSNPPWYNKELTNMKNKKTKAYKRFREDKSNLILKNIYIHSQKNFDVLNNFLYKSYILSTEKSLKENSKFFWTFVNSKRKSNGMPTFMTYSGKESSDNQEICNLFADYFKSVYTEHSNGNTSFSDCEPLLDLSVIELNILDIEHALLDIGNKTTLDSDGISNIFLYNCTATLSHPLLLIFQKSLLTGEFLNRWKLSQVVPVFKSGCKQDITNYRPISKILLIPKLFEKIVTTKITPIVENLLSDSQHGFRSGRSTTTNLTLFTNSVHRNFEKRLQTDVIFTDFAKAFDKVDHPTLLHKLLLLGFKSNLLCWIKSYLSDRFQMVKINATVSYQFKVTSGVPQGSHLGPILFLLFINDLPKVIRYSQSLLFADDLKIFRSISNLNDCLLLQSDLNAVVVWCFENNLQLNVKKCQTFTLYRTNCFIENNYHINSVSLSRVYSIKDLGLILDRKLNFISHIDFVSSKAYGMLGFLKRNSSEFNDPYTLKALYNALVRPHLEYCCVIWNPTYNSHISRIERVQKNFTRFVFFKLNWRMERPCYSTRCALFGLTSLESRRQMFSIFFIRDLIHCHIKCPALLALVNFYAPARTLRESFHFYNSVLRSNFLCNETLYHCTTICNSFLNLIDIFVGSSRHTFKQHLVMILNQTN